MKARSGEDSLSFPTMWPMQKSGSGVMTSWRNTSSSRLSNQMWTPCVGMCLGTSDSPADDDCVGDESLSKVSFDVNSLRATFDGGGRLYSTSDTDEDESWGAARRRSCLSESFSSGVYESLAQGSYPVGVDQWTRCNQWTTP